VKKAEQQEPARSSPQSSQRALRKRGKGQDFYTNTKIQSSEKDRARRRISSCSRWHPSFNTWCKRRLPTLWFYKLQITCYESQPLHPAGTVRPAPGLPREQRRRSRGTG